MKKEENKPNKVVLPIVLGIICAVLVGHDDQNNPMWILGFILGAILGGIINWQRSIRRRQN